MKKTLAIAAVIFCLLLGGSMVAYAAGVVSPHTMNNPSIGTIGGEMVFSMGAIKDNLAEVKEKASDMSVYEQHGLVHNQNKGGYYYANKLVGLFIDTHSRGISFLSQTGEVHIKAIRDNNGKLTGLAELSADEYNTIISDMDADVASIEAQLEKTFAEMECFMGEGFQKPPKPDVVNGLNPADLEQHMNEASANLEQHMKEIKPPSPPSSPSLH